MVTRRPFPINSIFIPPHIINGSRSFSLICASDHPAAMPPGKNKIPENPLHETGRIHPLSSKEESANPG
jgi:hypothetical protein